MTADQDLAGLPEDVREAFECLDRFESCPSGWTTIRAELLRLAHDCAEHAAWRDINERARFDQQQRAECAEAELAALKRRIAEAPTAKMDRHECSDGPAAYHVALGPALDPAGNAKIAGLYGQRVALLPVGGEG